MGVILLANVPGLDNEMWCKTPNRSPLRNKGHQGVVRTALNKEFPRPKPGEVSAFLCNFLHNHGVKPVKVLEKAGLRHAAQADWQDNDAVHALYMATLHAPNTSF
jgi:hypothetical protein